MRRKKRLDLTMLRKTLSRQLGLAGHLGVGQQRLHFIVCPVSTVDVQKFTEELTSWDHPATPLSPKESRFVRPPINGYS